MQVTPALLSLLLSHTAVLSLDVSEQTFSQFMKLQLTSNGDPETVNSRMMSIKKTLNYRRRGKA